MDFRLSSLKFYLSFWVFNSFSNVRKKSKAQLMRQTRLQKVSKAPNHIMVKPQEVLSYQSRNWLTLKFYSMHWTKLPFNFFCKNHCNQAIFLRQFRFHKFAFYQIIYIFHILHSSSNVKCYECTFDKIVL